MPTEDVTGLTPVGEEITEVLEYKQGELFVKKYVHPEYIRPTEEGTQAKESSQHYPRCQLIKVWQAPLYWRI